LTHIRVLRARGKWDLRKAAARKGDARPVFRRGRS